MTPPAAKTIPLEDFPALRENTSRRTASGHIARFLKGRIARKLGKNKVLLPSISQLSAYFQCSCMEVYDAFRQLRSHGCDYSFSGIDAPVAFWSVLSSCEYISRGCDEPKAGQAGASDEASAG